MRFWEFLWSLLSHHLGLDTCTLPLHCLISTLIRDILEHFNHIITHHSAENYSYRKCEVKRHSPNVTLGSVLAVQKLDFGINPNVPYSLYLGLILIWWKRGFWDQSQCLVQSVLGIDPNVVKNKVLGQIPELSILGFWDKSQNYQRNNSGLWDRRFNNYCLFSISPYTSKNKSLGSSPKLLKNITLG